MNSNEAKLKHRLSWSRIALPFTLALLSPAVTFAREDEVSMPGAACHHQAPAHSDFLVRNNAATQTVGADRIFVSCPVARHGLRSVENAFVYVSSEEVGCSLMITSADGQYIPVGDDPIARPVGAARRWIWGFGDGNLPAPTGATYVFTCLVPLGQIVFSYGITENVDED